MCVPGLLSQLLSVGRLANHIKIQHVKLSYPLLSSSESTGPIQRVPLGTSGTACKRQQHCLIDPVPRCLTQKVHTAHDLLNLLMLHRELSCSVLSK